MRDGLLHLHDARAVELEQRLMEGIYNKVFSLRSAAPAPEYAFFLDTLVHTVHQQIADCSQSAYKHMPAKDLTAWLGGDAKKTAEFVEERGWEQKDGEVYFNNAGGAGGDKKDAIPAMKVITNALAYATQLERII